MPMTAGFRMTQKDYQRLKVFAAKTDRAVADICRVAVLEYIDQQELVGEESIFAQRLAERDKQIVDALRSMENRFARILVRLGHDLEALYCLKWLDTPASTPEQKAQRKELFDRCYSEGVKRFKRPLKEADLEWISTFVKSGKNLPVAIPKEDQKKK